MIAYHPDMKIYLHTAAQKVIISHCMRKFTKAYLADETQEQQAYGILGGMIDGNNVYIGGVYPCKINFRNDPSVVNHMNDLIVKYAIPSDTPISQRGWVARPEEVMVAHDYFDSLGFNLLGSYHMHHTKSWNGGQPKELPSRFDEKLAENSNSLIFIVSITSEDQYSIGAFYNGLKEKEIKVIQLAT